MNFFTSTVTATTSSSAQQVAASEQGDRTVHVRVLGPTNAYAGLGFDNAEVSAADEGFLLYGGGAASFTLPGGAELWIGPAVTSNVLVSCLVTED